MGNNMYLCPMNEKTNSLDVKVTRPNQVLIIMRGIPGAGKSTKADAIAGDGAIHSTDDVITSQANYRDFFTKMIESGDFSELHKAHATNLKNAKESMQEGLSPVVIDNTHIKANEAKAVVVAALKMGFADENIQIVDVGDGGLDAEALAARNTHGVPLDKIQAMMQAHKSVGELTLKKILESKDIFKFSPILYSAVVLDQASLTKLLQMAGNYPAEIPENWVMGKHENGETKYFCDHMTICLGPLKDKSTIGKEVTLTVTHVGMSDMAMAFRVEGYETKNAIPHITLAVNKDGGMPKMSNDITKWQDIKHFFVNGVVTEISRYAKKDATTELKS